MSGAPADARAVVVFDGHCAFCSGWVDFLLARDRRGRLRFAAAQRPAGNALMRAHGLDPDDPSSFLLVEGDRARRDSDAAIAVLEALGGAWRAATLLRVVPRPLRDALYRAFARNRYRWYGRRDACRLPDPAERDRFLD